MLSYILPWVTCSTNKCVIGLYAGVSCCIHKLIATLRVVFTPSSADQVSHLAASARDSGTCRPCVCSIKPHLPHPTPPPLGQIASYCCNLRKYSTKALRKIHFRMGRGQAHRVWPPTGHRHSPLNMDGRQAGGSVSHCTRLSRDAPRGIAGMTSFFFVTRRNSADG